MKRSALELPATKDVALWIIHKRPGITEKGLAEAMWGPAGIQQDVNQMLDPLESQGLVERRRDSRPMTLWPVS